MTYITERILEQGIRYRKQLRFPFIGISGSSDRSVLLAMVSAILNRSGRLYSFPDTCDSAKAIAQKMLEIPLNCDWAVVKLSAESVESAMQEIELVAPEVGVVTNINIENLGRNEQVEAAANAKAILVRSLPGDGVAILNRDNDFTRQMAASLHARVLFFGLSEAADFYGANIEHLGMEGTAFTIRRKMSNSLRLRMPIYNLAEVYSSVAAAAIANVFGIDDEVVMEALEKDFFLPPGQGRPYKLKNMILIDETQHCSAHSILKSTKTLLNFRPYAKRLIFGMGAMRPMGDLTEEYHRRTGYYLAGMPIDLVFTVGKSGRIVAEAMASVANGKRRNIVSYDSIDDAIDALQRELRPGDALLVEGSEEGPMARIVEAIVAKYN